HSRVEQTSKPIANSDRDDEGQQTGAQLPRRPHHVCVGFTKLHLTQMQPRKHENTKNNDQRRNRRIRREYTYSAGSASSALNVVLFQRSALSDPATPRDRAEASATSNRSRG